MVERISVSRVLGVVLGAGAIAAIVAFSVLYRYDFLLVPFIPPAVFGLGILVVPLAVLALVHGFGAKRALLARVPATVKALAIATSVGGAITCIFLSFVAWWDEILFDMDKVVLLVFVILYAGGFSGWAIIATQSIALARGRQLPFHRNNAPGGKNTDAPAAGVVSTAVILCMVVAIGIAIPAHYLTVPDTCNREPGKFSIPAYEWSGLTSHVNNTRLDNVTAVNQTILSSLEKALWKMTTLQRAGGFPIGSDLDGRMYSDRGDGCPLFSDEFSLQGGTRLVAKVYLEMYEVTGETRYLNVARKAADALVAVQDQDNGGFFYDGRRHDENGPGYQPHPRNPNRANVLDDNVMQGCMDFLLDFYNMTLESKYLAAINKGLQCLLDTEKPAGGWPQCSNYPSYLYQSRITLNDNSLRDTVTMLIKAATMFPARADVRAMITRAGDFLARVQGNGGSPFQKGWAQQYDERTELPCWGRNFEPPAMSSTDGTKSAIETLFEIYAFTNDSRYLAPIPAALAWLNGSRVNYTDDGVIREGWARLYELGTNIPIFGRADGGPYRTPEYGYSPTRVGYSWYNSMDFNGLVADYTYISNHTIDEWRAYKSPVYTVGNTIGKAWEAHIALHDSGYWIDGSLIKDKVFAGYAMNMIRYIRAAAA